MSEGIRRHGSPRRAGHTHVGNVELKLFRVPRFARLRVPDSAAHPQKSFHPRADDRGEDDGPQVTVPRPRDVAGGSRGFGGVAARRLAQMAWAPRLVAHQGLAAGTGIPE